ncbi:MAG TPA: hypothetical protein VJ553_03545 [Candidatus Paceibacterota bacterium]|nr:hypothetical protein [Candidatus Paceibacterota bacterium]
MAWPLIATVAAFVFDISFLASIPIFFGPLLALLAFLARRAFVRSVLFAIVIAISVTTIIDTIAHASGAWIAKSAFPYRILGLAPWEDVILGVFLVTSILLYYEWHVQHHRSFPLVAARWRRFIVFIGLLIAAVVFAWLWDPESLIFSDAFLKLGLFSILLPCVLELSRHHALTGKFARTALYWTYVLFLYELAGVYNFWWHFPSDDYVGWIQIMNIGFPLEEFVFWIAGASLAMLAYYEFFLDDGR